MLTTDLKTPRTLEHYRSGLAGPHLNAFAVWLEAQRYQSRRILHLLRGAHRFSCWPHSAGFSMQALDVQALQGYGHHLQGIQRLRYPSGRYSHLFVGARHRVRLLETAGVVAPATSILPPPPEPALLGAFRQRMQTHRGTTQATLNGYRLTITPMLHMLGDQPACLTARALRPRLSSNGLGLAALVVPKRS